MRKKIKFFIRILCAFLKRDFLLNSSYRTAFFFDLAGIFFSTITFFFVAKLFGQMANPFLAAYGGDYFAFVIIGLAFSGYLSTAMSTFMASIREEQTTGTIENILLTPINISILAIAGSVWNFLFTSFRIFIYLLIGWLMFGLNLNKVNYLSCCVILTLTILSFGTLGIISASFILVFKKGDPISSLFSSLSRFLGGVYFPITILPLWFQKLALFLPITYSLRAIRMAVLQGSGVFLLWKDILMLCVFTVVLLPVGIFSFKFAIQKAKKQGSLLHY